MTQTLKGKKCYWIIDVTKAQLLLEKAYLCDEKLKVIL